MYLFTNNGVRVLCGACHRPTPVHTTTAIKVGTPPAYGRIQTGRWDFDRNEPETRLAKYPRTRTVDACEACVDRLARQKRTGGYNFLIERATPAAIADRPTTTSMPRLVKRARLEAP